MSAIFGRQKVLGDKIPSHNLIPLRLVRSKTLTDYVWFEKQFCPNLNNRCGFYCKFYFQSKPSGLQEYDNEFPQMAENNVHESVT